MTRWPRRVRWAGAALAAIAVGWAAGLRVEPPGPAAIESHDPGGVIRQRGADDCGVAVTAMLLSAAGQPVDLDALWRVTEVPRGGLTPHEIAALATRWQLPARAFASPVNEYASVPTPWIAHLRWRHYVLVESTAGPRIVVADPRGRRDAYSPAAFMRAWSGYGVRRATDLR